MIKLSNYDSTWGGRRTLDRLNRRRRRVGSSFSLSSNKTRIYPVLGNETLPEDTLTLRSPGVGGVEEGYDERNFHGTRETRNRVPR